MVKKIGKADLVVSFSLLGLVHMGYNTLKSIKSL